MIKSFFVSKLIKSYFAKELFMLTSVGQRFYVCWSHSNILKFVMCRILFTVIFIAKLYLLHSSFFSFSFNFVHFVLKSFLKPFFPFTFLFSFSLLSFFQSVFLSSNVFLSLSLDQFPSWFYISQWWANGDLQRRWVRGNESGCFAVDVRSCCLHQVLGNGWLNPRGGVHKASQVFDPQ